MSYASTANRCGERKKGHGADALAQEGDEGRGKLRKAAVRCRRPVTRGCPNGATRQYVVLTFLLMREGEPGELKHLSSRRKRKQNVIPPVVASERGIAQTMRVEAFMGLWDHGVAKS